MKKSKFFFINELINNQIIKKYILLNKTEYSKKNPICLEEHLIWKYLNNPRGFSYAINGYLEDKLIARISYQKKSFIFKNQIIKGANLCDLLINKKNRKLDNFLKLTKPYFINKDIPGANISIMIPNEVSINIYKKLLNLKPIGSLELRFIPIISSIIYNKLKFKIPKFLTSIFNNTLFFIIKILQYITKLSFSDAAVENEEYKKMISNYYKDNLLQGERSKQWIEWRYNQKSSINYYLEYLYLDNELIGYFAYRRTEKKGFKLLMIMEIVIIKKNFFIELTILLKLIQASHKLNCDLILTLRSIQKNNPLSNFLFPKIPNFLLPTPLDFFVVTNETSLPQIFDIKNWKINMADFDIF